MHVVSVNNLILFFSCGHGHFCLGVVSWWGDIIREGLKKYAKNLRLLPLKRWTLRIFLTFPKSLKP